MNTCYKLLLEQLENHKNKKIAFYGASLLLKEFIQNNNLEQYNIIGIIDKDSSKEGTFFEGYKIFKLENLADEIDYIIFTVRNKNLNNYKLLYNMLETQHLQDKLLPNIFDILEIIANSNKIYVCNEFSESTQINEVKGLNVIWQGYDSVIEIASSSLNSIINSTIICGYNSYVKIGENCCINKLSLHLIEKSTFTLGNNSSIEEGQFVCARSGKIIIGEDNVLSTGIFIRSTDGHLIFDKNTNERINYDKDIVTGNHVWIGQNATLLKGSCINDNSVVGASSLVTKAFDETNVIIAGNPAKIVKKDIYWTR